jgi:hypothetical protein
MVCCVVPSAYRKLFVCFLLNQATPLKASPVCVAPCFCGSWVDRLGANVLLAAVGYMHWTDSHLAHHVKVGHYTLYQLIHLCPKGISITMFEVQRTQLLLLRRLQRASGAAILVGEAAPSSVPVSSSPAVGSSLSLVMVAFPPRPRSAREWAGVLRPARCLVPLRPACC